MRKSPLPLQEQGDLQPPWVSTPIKPRRRALFPPWSLPAVCTHGTLQMLGTDHLDPRLACHPDPATFRVNRSPQREGEVNIHPLLGDKRFREVGRNIFPAFR